MKYIEGCIDHSRNDGRRIRSFNDRFTSLSNELDRAGFVAGDEVIIISKSDFEDLQRTVDDSFTHVCESQP